MIIFIAANNPEFSSARIRLLTHYNYMKSIGIDVFWYTNGSGYIPTLKSGKHIAYFQKCFSKEHISLAKNLKKRGFRIVYDLSDIVPPGCENWKGTNAMLRIMHAGTACSWPMVGWMDARISMMEMEKPVYYIPDAIEPHNFGAKTHIGDDPVIGWYGFAKSFDRFVFPMMYVFSQYKNFFIFNQDPNFPQHVPDRKWDYKTWQTSVHANIDIGICPLPLDNPNVQSKSCHKVNAFLSMGIPVIASPITEYLFPLEAGGMTAMKPDGWRMCIEHLFPAKNRRIMGYNGYRRVNKHYSVESLNTYLLKYLSGDVKPPDLQWR